MKSWRGVQNNREYESQLALEIATTGLFIIALPAKQVVSKEKEEVQRSLMIMHIRSGSVLRLLQPCNDDAPPLESCSIITHSNEIL